MDEFESFEMDLEDETMYEDLELYEDFEDYEDWEDFEDYEGDMFFSSIPWRKVGGNIASTLVHGLAKKGPEWVDKGLKSAGWLESEGEFEAEFAMEGGNVQILDEMDYYAELAAQAGSEEEADYFLGAIASLAGPLISSLVKESDYEDWEDFEDYEGDQFFPALAALAPIAAPLIGKGIQAIGKMLREDAATKPAVKAIPKIVANTTKALARQAKSGQPVSQQAVAKKLATETKKVLSNKEAVAAAVKRNKKAADRAKSKPAVSKKVAVVKKVKPKGRKARLVGMR
jgi:hypothetical protein